MERQIDVAGLFIEKADIVEGIFLLRVNFQRLFELLKGLIIHSLHGVNDTQVRMGYGQTRVYFNTLLKGLDGLIEFAELRISNAQQRVCRPIIKVYESGLFKGVYGLFK